MGLAQDVVASKMLWTSRISIAHRPPEKSKSRNPHGPVVSCQSEERLHDNRDCAAIKWAAKKCAPSGPRNTSKITEFASSGFSYGNTIQRPQVSMSIGAAANAVEGAISCARNRDVRQFHSRRNVGGDLFEYINFQQRYDIAAAFSGPLKRSREVSRAASARCGPRNSVGRSVEWLNRGRL